jgi:Tfp pilus assembly protein PilP
MKHIQLLLIPLLASSLATAQRSPEARQPAHKKEKSLQTSLPTPLPTTASTGDPDVVNYRYEVKGRRDPFRTLDVANSIQATAAPVLRPPGIKGQLVAEIKLVGIVKSKGNIMAIAEGYRGRTFFIHPKDDLYDGKVIEIRNDSVVFTQSLTDSSGKKVSRQVFKKLYPTRGEGNNEK